MLFNCKYKPNEKYNEIESEIFMKTMKNVMNFGNCSKNEIKESLNNMENMSTQFSLWLKDLEAKVKDAVTSRNKEIILEKLQFSEDNNSNNLLGNFPLNKFFGNFERLKIECDEIEIEQEIEKYLKENKRPGNKRRKNFSFEDERNFIKKKPKENLGLINESNYKKKRGKAILNEENLEMKEIDEDNCSNLEICSVNDKIKDNAIMHEKEENVSEKILFNLQDNISMNPLESKQNALYMNYNNNLSLKEVIEEMPSKEEDNFKFSLSIIDKKDSNVEMKENIETEKKIDQIDFDRIIENPPDSNEPVLNFNLKSLSGVKSNEDKCSDSISSLNNFNINEIIANFHDSNFNFSEEKMKEIEKEKQDKKIIPLTISNLDNYENDKTNEHRKEADIINHTEMGSENLKTNISNPIPNTSTIDNYNIISDCVKIVNPANNSTVKNMNDTHGPKEKKLIFKSSNIKLNNNNNINNINSKTSKSDLQPTPSNNDLQIPYNNPDNPIHFTFFKEKHQNQISNTKITADNKGEIGPSTTITSKSNINNFNPNSTLKDIKEPIVITNNNVSTGNNNNNLTSNFLKDKDDLFKILFNYNESYSNLEESPAVEKWDPTKLESSKGKVINLKNNLNLNYVQSDSNTKIKFLTNKNLKLGQEESGKDNIETNGNFFKSSKQNKQMITPNNQNSQQNQNSNKFSKSKILKANSPTYDPAKVTNIKNNITKTLSKKIIDPGYEITDNSASSSDEKNDSDLDEKVFGTPIFKNLKIPKFIPKWANDKKYINERVLYQKTHMDYKSIFGSCKVDNLNLNLIFTNSKKEYNQPRGDSADWRLDNTMSSHCEEKNPDGVNSNINSNNNYNQYSNYKYFNRNNTSNNKKILEGPNRKLLDVFNQNENF